MVCRPNRTCLSSKSTLTIVTRSSHDWRQCSKQFVEVFDVNNVFLHSTGNLQQLIVINSSSNANSHHLHILSLFGVTKPSCYFSEVYTLYFYIKNLFIRTCGLVKNAEILRTSLRTNSWLRKSKNSIYLDTVHWTKLWI